MLANIVAEVLREWRPLILFVTASEHEIKCKCLLLTVDMIACGSAQVSGVALIALFKEKKEKPRS